MCCPQVLPHAARSARSSRSGYAAPQLTESTFVLLDALAALAADRETSVAAVALAWVRQRPEITSTLIGARTIAQLDANLASADVTLVQDQIDRLNALTEPQLESPMNVIRSFGLGFQQGDTTINGVSSAAYAAPDRARAVESMATTRMPDWSVGRWRPETVDHQQHFVLTSSTTPVRSATAFRAGKALCRASGPSRNEVRRTNDGTGGSSTGDDVVAPDVRMRCAWVWRP